jgi:hypothetical protein
VFIAATIHVVNFHGTSSRLAYLCSVCYYHLLAEVGGQCVARHQSMPTSRGMHGRVASSTYTSQLKGLCNVHHAGMTRVACLSAERPRAARHGMDDCALVSRDKRSWVAQQPIYPWSASEHSQGPQGVKRYWSSVLTLWPRKRCGPLQGAAAGHPDNASPQQKVKRASRPPTLIAPEEPLSPGRGAGTLTLDA